MPDPTSDVIIAGLGLTPLREHWDQSLRDLAHQAVTAALQDATGVKPQALYVANMLSGPLSGQSQLGALIADYTGLGGIEAHTVEAAGASGGVALRQAFMALKAGEIDTALVLGVEKVSEQVSSEVDAAMTSATDADYEAVQGVTPTALAALVMRRYLHETGAPDDGLAGFSVNAHANAVSNPNAMFRRSISADAYRKGGMISEPVNMFDAAPLADGAAALLLARQEVLPPDWPFPSVRIAASAARTSSVALHDQEDPLDLRTARETAKAVYQRAEIGPEDVDLFELHDLFTIYAALALEAANFAERGEGWKLAAENEIGLDGRIPVCTFGGSKARGDTAGATGVFQAAEATLQLQGRAGENQVDGARVALIQCLGANAATCATHILIRDGDSAK